MMTQYLMNIQSTGLKLTTRWVWPHLEAWREDEACLFYLACIHSQNGEPELVSECGRALFLHWLTVPCKWAGFYTRVPYNQYISAYMSWLMLTYTWPALAPISMCPGVCHVCFHRNWIDFSFKLSLTNKAYECLQCL